MKTIQFILSFILVAVLASCSADNDVLNEMENDNQVLVDDELVSISLNLSAETALGTRAVGEKDTEDASPAEQVISNYGIVVYGQGGIILKKESIVPESKSDASQAKVTFKFDAPIKKQDLEIYVAANLSDPDMTAFKADPKTTTGFLQTTAATKLPKYQKVIALKSTMNTATPEIKVKLEQLTARIDYPDVKENTGLDAKFVISEVSVSNAKTEPNVVRNEIMTNGTSLYVYPNETKITVSGFYVKKEAEVNNDGEFDAEDKYYEGRVFKFKSYDIKGTKDDSNAAMQSNMVYKLIMTVDQPDFSGSDVPGALGIDWFIAPMLEEDAINGELTLPSEN